MKFATKSQHTQVLAWLIWLIALLVFTWMPEQAAIEPTVGSPALVGIVTHDCRDGPLFPWEPQRRVRTCAWRRYRALERARRRARWIKHLAQLALRGALTMAAVVDLLPRPSSGGTWGPCPCCMG